MMAVVIADERRRDMAGALLARWNGACAALAASGELAAPIPAAVTYGGSGVSPWAGMRLALLRREVLLGECTHIFILEDDAEITDRTPVHAVHAARAWPYDAVSLFHTMQQAGDESDAASAAGLAYTLCSSRPVGSVAMVIPAPMARAMIRYYTAWNDAEFAAYNPGAEGAGDARLWWFATRVLSSSIVITTHSLVGHRCASPEESIAQTSRPAMARHAYRPIEGVRGAAPASPCGPFDERALRHAILDARATGGRPTIMNGGRA